MLKLYADYRNTDTKAAFGEIKEAHPGGQWIVRPKAEKKAMAPLDVRHKTYSALLNLLTLTGKHRADLRGRGLSDQEIDRLQYRSVPQAGFRKLASRLLDQGCALDGVPGFYVCETGEWTANFYRTGIIMPCRDYQGRVQGLQVRKDDAQKHKCYWFTGAEKEQGVSLTPDAHFANPETAGETARLTEGVMKGDIAAFLGDEFFVSVQGVGCFDALARALPVLRLMGVRRMIVDFDMDYRINPNVQESLTKVQRMIRDAGFECESDQWDAGAETIDERRKGIDDLYLWKKIQALLAGVCSGLTWISRTSPADRYGCPGQAALELRRPYSLEQLESGLRDYCGSCNSCAMKQ